VVGDLEEEFARRSDALRRDYDARLAELRASYPQLIARRLAEGLLRSAGGARSASELLAVAAAAPDPMSPTTPASSVPGVSAASGTPAGGAAPNANGTGASMSSVAVVEASAPAPPAAAPDESPDDDLAMEPYIDSARCTTCNECTNLNGKLFAYNAEKQAYIRDPKAGTFAQLVQAAEKCPVAAIHPGTPMNPKEKDLAKWVERAKPFN
jgi:pyruvate-ferredoxin/flavodoxin oxidoreductase